ncbi:MAG: DUF92 domain-containing protein [Clostridia bacterium]|nr:DUF92 domain-containing protein [Clostridia bacterium]
MILKGYIFGTVYALLCLALALVLYKLGMPKKYSRKLVHILVGAEWVILSHYMGATYHFLMVCLLFLVILLVSYLKNLMPMISSESDNAPGTVYYAVAMSIMAIICLFEKDMMLPFGIGVLCTSLGDGFAGVFGQMIKKINPKIYGNKSLYGTLANFAFSSGAAIFIKYAYGANIALWQCFMVGILSAGLELITVFGLDNIVITVGTALLSYAFINYSLINSFVIPIVATPFIIAIVLEKKVLTKSGLLLAMILDAVVSLTLGNFGFVLLCVFLFGSVLIDKVKKHRRGKDTVTKKEGCRDAIQVIANGLIPMIFAVLYSVTQSEAFLVGYVAALAEAFADTAASGMGVFSNNPFDLFKMRRVKCGLSGGMSLVGTASSLVAAFVIGAIALAFGAISPIVMVIASLAAFVGAVFDSFLGSVFQIKYKCKKCGEIVEREEHCATRCERYSGFEFFDNDVVNLFSGAFAATLAALLFYLIF